MGLPDKTPRFSFLTLRKPLKTTHVPKGSLLVNKGSGRHPTVGQAASLWPPWQSPARLEMLAHVHEDAEMNRIWTQNQAGHVIGGRKPGRNAPQQ